MNEADQKRFKYAFRAGEVIAAGDALARFHDFVPRAGASDARYAEKIEKAGLALLTDSETVRDIPRLKALDAEAAKRHLPIIFSPASLPDPDVRDPDVRAAEHDAAKVSAVLAAREAAR